MTTDNDLQGPSIAALGAELPHANLNIGSDPLSLRALALANFLSVAAFVVLAVGFATRQFDGLTQTLFNACLVGSAAIFLGSIAVLVLRGVIRTFQTPSVVLVLLEENWRKEQDLIKRLRAYPVDQLAALGRRLKTERAILEGSVTRLNLLAAFSAGATALYLAFAPGDLKPRVVVPVTIQIAAATATVSDGDQAPTEPKPWEPDPVHVALAGLMVVASLVALAQNPEGAKLHRLELLLTEACAGERRGQRTLNETPTPPTLRRKLAAQIGRSRVMQRLAALLKRANRVCIKLSQALLGQR
jgi:hypothetical protein